MASTIKYMGRSNAVGQAEMTFDPEALAEARAILNSRRARGDSLGQLFLVVTFMRCGTHQSAPTSEEVSSGIVARVFGSRELARAEVPRMLMSLDAGGAPEGHTFGAAVLTVDGAALNQ